MYYISSSLDVTISNFLSRDQVLLSYSFL